MPPQPRTGPHSGARDSGTHRETLLQATAAAILTAAGILGVWAAFFPHELSYVEGYLLEQGTRLAHGGALYRPLGDPAWLVDNFPPLYPLIIAATTALFGPSFTPGRLLTLFAIAGLGVLLYHWARSRGATSAVAWGIVALFVVSPWVLRRGVIVRMDLFGILLVAAAIWWFLKWHETRPKSALAGAAFLFAAAWATRQTLLAAPAALVLALWLNDQKTTALRLGLLATAIVAAIITGLTLWTHGGFLHHIIGYNLGEWNLDSFLRRTLNTAWRHLPLLALGTLGAVAAWRERTLHARTLSLWFLFAALSTITTGKAGSDYNHHLEALFTAALLAPTGLRTLTTWARNNTHQMRSLWASRTHTLTVLLVVQLIVSGATIPFHSSIMSLATADEQNRLDEILTQSDGPVLSERAGPLVLSGHEVLWEPRTTLELHRAGAWDDHGLVQSLQEGRWSIVITESFTRWHSCDEGCRWTPDAWHALNEHYERDEDLGRWVVWRPRTP